MEATERVERLRAALEKIADTSGEMLDWRVITASDALRADDEAATPDDAGASDGYWRCFLCKRPKDQGHTPGCSVGQSEEHVRAHGVPPGPPSPPNLQYEWITGSQAVPVEFKATPDDAAREKAREAGNDFCSCWDIGRSCNCYCGYEARRMAAKWVRDVSIDIDALEALAKAATPGPWVLSTDHGDATAEVVCMALGDQNYLRDVMARHDWDCGTDLPVEDAAFIAAAHPFTVLALIARVREAEGLLETFIDSEACRFDHHGYCQAHGWFGEGPCNMARARALLARRADAP